MPHLMTLLGMERDTLDLLVDLATVVIGATAVVAIGFSLYALRVERERSEQAWRRQVALDHHARIYEAASALIAAVSTFTRLAEAATATPVQGVTVQPSISDSLAHDQPVEFLADSLGTAMKALHHLYFLIPGGKDQDACQLLLIDLLVIREALTAVAPQRDYYAGTGDLVALLDGHSIRQQVELLVDTESLGPEHPTKRLRFLRELLERYFRGRIGKFVPPPPISEV